MRDDDPTGCALRGVATEKKMVRGSRDEVKWSRMLLWGCMIYGDVSFSWGDSNFEIRSND